MLFCAVSQFVLTLRTVYYLTNILMLIVLNCSATPTGAKPHLGELIQSLISSSSSKKELFQCSLFFMEVGESPELSLNPLIQYLSTSNPIPAFYATFSKNDTISGESSLFSTPFTDKSRDLLYHWTYRHKRVHGPYCSLIVSFFGDSSESRTGESKDKHLSVGHKISNFYEQVVTGLPGLVKKDEDFFLFVGNTRATVDALLNVDSVLWSKIKYRVGLVAKVANNRQEHDLEVTNADVCFNGVNLGERSNPREFHQDFAEALIFNRMSNMRGSTLLVSTPLSTRWLNEMTQSSDDTWIPKRGPYKLVLNILESTLNFTSSHFPSTGGGTGALVNGSVWIGTVGDVLQGRADLGHVTAETWARSRVVEHSFPISHEWLTFSTGLPQPFYSWRAIYRPLSTRVWPWVAAALVGSWTVFYVLVTIHNSEVNSFRRANFDKAFRQESNWSGWKLGFTLGECVLATLLDQAPKSPTELLKSNSRSKSISASGAIRNLTITWLMFTLLISTAYRSKLVTFLAFPNVEPPPDSFESLAMSNYKIGLQYIKGAAYQVFKHSKNPTYFKIFKRMSLEPNDVNCFLAAVKSRFACISWDSIAEFVKHRNLTDAYGRSPVVKSPSSTLNINAGLVMEKRAVFKNEINHILRWITDTGILTKIRILDFQFIRSQRNEWLRSSGGQKPLVDSSGGGTGSSGAKPLTMAHFIGSFCIFGITTLLCFLGFWAEFVYFWRKRRKISKEIRIVKISLQAMKTLNEFRP